MPGEYDELYVVAREVLLDALEALGEHRSSIVVGAQAIYLRTGTAARNSPARAADTRGHGAR